MGKLLVGIVGAALLAAGAVQASPLTDGGATAQEIAKVLQDKGYKAQIGEDQDGDPTISSAADGSNFQVYFFGCKAGRCNSIQFHAAYDLANGMALERINTWNRTKRFGRAFLDDVQDPFVQMDVDLEHGSTTESVSNNLDTWLQVQRAFRTYIRE